MWRQSVLSNFSIEESESNEYNSVDDTIRLYRNGFSQFYLVYSVCPTKNYQYFCVWIVIWNRKKTRRKIFIFEMKSIKIQNTHMNRPLLIEGKVLMPWMEIEFLFNWYTFHSFKTPPEMHLLYCDIWSL